MRDAKNWVQFTLFAVVLIVLMAAQMPLIDPVVAEARDIFSFFKAEQLEYRTGDGFETFNWEAEGWLGTDYNRVWMKTQGETVINGKVEDAEVQVLFSRLIAPFWDLQAGLRYDARPEPSRGFAVLGLQGLAPFFFEVDAAMFLSDDGDVSARITAEYELLFTQRLIASPSIEMNLALQDVEELAIGSGVSNIELGLRLRYEILREFAPYIGVTWRRKVGETADFARRRGKEADNLMLAAGIRLWF